MQTQFLSLQLHIAYLRSLEDSERTRAACINHLQHYLPVFYPDRLDLVKEMEHLAASLGGRLENPRLFWKYAWIQKAFGLPLAKRAQILLPRCKWSMIRSWDKALSLVERRILAG
jgi:hypothetical protein